MVTLLNGGYFGFIENGEFLSLDLGGSKFRVLKVQVSQEGKQNVQMESQFYPTPNEIIRGNGTEVPAGGTGLGTGGRRWYRQRLCPEPCVCVLSCSSLAT